MNPIRFFTTTAVAACLLCGTAAAEEAKPNILFIFADDMSFETIGASGMLDIDTPNLDRLARRGTTFTHAYNMGAWNGAVCEASRAMLNSGKFLWDARAANMKSLANEKHVWSQRMQDAGYQTYMTGKWHVHVDAHKVFDLARHVRAGMPMQTPAGYNRPKNEAAYQAGWKPWDPEQGGFWEGGKHWSEVVADDGIDYLQMAAEDDKPFFMYLAFNAAHDPRQSPKEYVDRYPLDRIEVPENFLAEYPYADSICGKKLRDEKLMPYPRTEYAVKVNRQEYFALITHMDDQIGRILAALEESGKADNTYIFFTADHGLAVGHHGLAGKQNMYEDSVRPPFMIVGPDVTPGLNIETPIYLQDVMPTSLALADADLKGIDFKSLLPILNQETLSDSSTDQSAKHYDSIFGAYMGTQRMLMKGNWKLISYPTINVTRLFNLVEDPEEMIDLAGNPEYASTLKRLRSDLESQMDELDDPMTSLAAADYPTKRPKSKSK